MHDSAKGGLTVGVGAAGEKGLLQKSTVEYTAHNAYDLFFCEMQTKS